MTNPTNNLEQVEKVVALLRNYPFTIREDKLVHPQGSIIISQTEWDGLVKLLVNELQAAHTKGKLEGAIEELELHAPEWVEINEDGSINPSVVHDRLAELKNQRKSNA